MEIKNIEESIQFNKNNLTKKIIFDKKDILSFVLNIKAGQFLPVHKHENSSLVFFVIEGNGEVRINNQQNRIEKGSIVYVKGEDQFSIPIVTSDLSILVNIAPNSSNKIYSKEAD